MARKQCQIGDCNEQIQTQETNDIQDMIKSEYDTWLCNKCILNSIVNEGAKDFIMH